MKASVAAERLGEILLLDAVGDLLDALGDAETRDLVGKVVIRLRCIVDDEREAAGKQP
jgi:hypothetical protein